jgi:hypothetical protein
MNPASTGLALLRANLRYWTRVRPVAQTQLHRWDQAAQRIPDPHLRAAAIQKLTAERLNVEMAATAATVAERAHRDTVTRAIVAIQVLYDYLDLLGELDGATASGAKPGLRLLDAVDLEAHRAGPHCAGDTGPGDGGYSRALAQAALMEIARLPAIDRMLATMRTTTLRCVEAQDRWHSSGVLASAELESWAATQALGTGLCWQEMLAGASASVLSVHALVAAASDPASTESQARAIDAVYLRVGALTMLDSLVDQVHDLGAGQPNYLSLYESQAAMVERLRILAREAHEMACGLAHASHHRMTILGLVAYYCSALERSNAQALAATEPLRRDLGPLLHPPLWILRHLRHDDASELSRNPQTLNGQLVA